MIAAPLVDLTDRIARTEGHLLHSLVIVRDQKLVFEEYWPGVDLEPGTLNPVTRDFDRETLHYVASVSKSITSYGTLYGYGFNWRLGGSRTALGRWTTSELPAGVGNTSTRSPSWT